MVNAIIVSRRVFVRLRPDIACEVVMIWCNLQKLVIFDKVDTLLQAKLRKWRQLHSSIRRFGAHVSQMLGFTNVDFDVFLAIVIPTIIPA